MPTTTKAPRTFTPEHLVKIINAITAHVEPLRDRTWHEGAINGHDTLRGIDAFLFKHARTLDRQGWYEWRAMLMLRIRESLNVENWLEYYQALGRIIDAAQTLPTEVDLDAATDDDDALDRGCVEYESCL